MHHIQIDVSRQQRLGWRTYCLDISKGLQRYQLSLTYGFEMEQGKYSTHLDSMENACQWLDMQIVAGHQVLSAELLQDVIELLFESYYL